MAIMGWNSTEGHPRIGSALSRSLTQRWLTTLNTRIFLQHQLFVVYLRTNQQSVAMIIILSSFVALAYNITHNFLLQRTSAVTVTVLGEVKIVGLLLLSAILLPGEAFTESKTSSISQEHMMPSLLYRLLLHQPIALDIRVAWSKFEKQIYAVKPSW